MQISTRSDPRIWTQADKWFLQTIGAASAIFRRSAKAGSLYLMGLRDKAGGNLEGGKTYRLTVPQPALASCSGR
jgi:hypothetical protein